MLEISTNTFYELLLTSAQLLNVLKIHISTFYSQFINILRARFLNKKLAPKIQSQKVSRKKLLKDFRMKKVRVKCEIDTWI